MAGLHGFEGDKDYDGILIPNGAYRAMIVETEEIQNSKKTGTYLKIVFDVLEGPQKGRHVWLNLNLDNPSEQAVRISRAVLKQICIACGGLTPTDSSDLHGIPLVIHVDREERNDNGQWKNRITRYESLMTVPEKETAGAEAAKDAPWKT